MAHPGIGQRLRESPTGTDERGVGGIEVAEEGKSLTVLELQLADRVPCDHGSETDREREEDASLRHRAGCLGGETGRAG